MANVDEYLQKIMSARYGEEVRGSIHDAISAMNTESTSAMEYAKDGAESAQASAQTATEQVDLCKAEVQNAKAEVDKAKAEVTKAGEKAVLAESYAHGGTGTRAGEDSDNAKYYMEQAKSIASGGLIPMGSLSWAEFKLAQADASTGFMYHITDEYYIDDTFEDYDPDNQENNLRPAGSEVYLSASGAWETTAGREVVGIRLEGETEWKRGHVEIPKATANGFGVVKGEYDGYLGTKNLAPKLENKGIDGAGVFTYTSNYVSTDYFKVMPNTQYAISASSSESLQIGINSFSEIGGTATFITSGWQAFSGEYVIETPTNCNYLIVTFKKPDTSVLDSNKIQNLQVEKGNEKTSYIAHIYNGTELERNKSEKSVIADAFSPKQNLTQGALRIWNADDELYKAKQNITQPTDNPILPSNTTYFERTSIANEISAINASLSANFKQVTSASGVTSFVSICAYNGLKFAFISGFIYVNANKNANTNLLWTELNVPIDVQFVANNGRSETVQFTVRGNTIKCATQCFEGNYNICLVVPIA